MPARWRTQATRLQSLAVEVCWRPFDGEVAGDFSDLVDLQDGRVAAVLGDAPGFGPPAAELADKVRYSLRRALRETDSPEEVMSRLDLMIAREHEDVIVTAVCAVVDPGTHIAEVSSAGHLPILTRTGTEATYLDRGSDPPLGVVATRSTQCYLLERDATLFFFTDGLVERRNRSLDLGLQVLADLAADMPPAAAWASELARRATEQLGQPTDDATVLSVRLAETTVALIVPAVGADHGAPGTGVAGHRAAAGAASGVVVGSADGFVGAAGGAGGTVAGPATVGAGGPAGGGARGAAANVVVGWQQRAEPTGPAHDGAPAIPIGGDGPEVVLRVYVDSGDLRARRTRAVVQELVDRLAGELEVAVEVVDLRAAGAQAEADGVLAAPTVLRLSPAPVVRVIGGLRSAADLARALQLPFPEDGVV